jgi:hypothetical protein
MIYIATNQQENETMIKGPSFGGWTNYPTWLVQLKIFDSWDDTYPPFIAGEITPESAEKIANNVLDDRMDSITLCFARALLSYVNWHEIAERINENRTS